MIEKQLTLSITMLENRAMPSTDGPSRTPSSPTDIQLPDGTFYDPLAACCCCSCCA